MKIAPVINAYHYTRIHHRKDSNGITTADNQYNDKTFQNSIANVFYQPLSTISFKNARKDDFVDNIRNVPGVTCACCGIEVYPYETISRIEDEQLFFFMPEAVKMLIKTGLFNPNNANRQEQEAFQYLNSLAKKYPDKSLKNVMDLYETQKEMKETLSPETRNQIKYYNHSLKKLCRNSKDMVEIMEPYENHFSGVYKEIFDLLKEYSQKYPEKDFNYILNVPNVYYKHLKKLQKKQRSIVYKIEHFTKQNYPQYEKLLKRKTEIVKNIIFDEDTKIPQKRQRIIDTYAELQTKTDPLYMQKILQIAQELPKSSNSVSAFIAKYSYRSSEEIAHLILVSGASSEEHIKPQNRDKKDKGPDTNDNKIVMCAACNSQRSKTSYKDWLLIHPEMIQNCQKYIDKIIDSIISGKLVNYNDYPQKVKKSLSDESGGMIEINIDRYKDYYENHPTYKHPNKQI